MDGDFTPILQTTNLLGRVADETGDPALDVIQEWHRDEHGGAFAHCDRQPCHAVVRAVDLYPFD